MKRVLLTVCIDEKVVRSFCLEQPYVLVEGGTGRVAATAAVAAHYLERHSRRAALTYDKHPDYRSLIQK